MPEEKKSKILIVEDEQHLLSIYATIFQKEGMEVLTAQTGEDGYRLAEEHTPDVMLLDILLPGGMDGLAVLRKLKENNATRQIPVMITSNLADDETISEGLSLGATGYFTKSQFSPDDVVKNVRTIINQ